ncbi:RagB/SusD family nutrient uptake outer membrane protein [Reichenbachiella versicolor]|uniref:RagB/SusD family nutrient uptake outer membrane protein n=1 Tax=Reichenbachiella versicolor TaxID=1821036 RepID=UPI000D6E7A6C|nr:RagB/SusD family nutrient uptake outer membrane protein [Reichenbachiella versicolor]
MKKYIYALFMALIVLSACQEEFFEPKYSNEQTLEEIIGNPQIVQGFLMNAYNVLPNGHDHYGGFLDCATQNAVRNNLNTALSRTIEQTWQAAINPLNNWNNTYKGIQSVNRFITYGLKPVGSELREDSLLIFFQGPSEEDSIINAELRQRLTGEAHFLRGYFYFDLLKRFAGIDESGEVMGVPLITELQNPQDIESLPRATFSQVIDQIATDLKIAADTLPAAYDGTAGADLIVYSAQEYGRPTSVAANALLSRVYLYAGSELYEQDNRTEMNEMAAAYAAKVMDEVGTSLPNVYGDAGNSDYDAYFTNYENAEMIMARIGGQNRSIETRNFPPSFGGQGQTNPTQNLVDAFPMADNGYPISDPSSGYDATNPYAGRDPRLDLTVFHNGVTFQNGETVDLFQGGKDVSGGATGVANESNSSRTGYYLRKWLAKGADIGQGTNAFHYFALIRKGEVFLNYAEAMNEAYGPENDPEGFGLTAVDAIAEVRRRGGILSDDYLTDNSSNQSVVREIIRNERRIELCFEGHYFFDLRRWGGDLSDLNTTVEKMTITRSGSTDSYDISELFTPQFDEHMKFGPMPIDELLKVPTLTENEGW